MAEALPNTLYPFPSPSDLPPAESAIFLDSSFFLRNGSTCVFPSPADILAEARQRGVANEYNPRPLYYPSLGLAVKYGRTVSTAEGQCLWALGHLPGNPVPVPEVYGWKAEAGFSYIYMEFIPGETLGNRWDSLSELEKRDISLQLRTMIDHLRTIEQPNGEKFIGNISRQHLLDVAFTHSLPAGPFVSVADFHDFFVGLLRPHMYGPNDPPHPRRLNLPDDVPIVFTHGDLHQNNVIVSSRAEGGRPLVKAIIDWGQSGWYPSYWEFCKARWSTGAEEDWDTFILLFLDEFNCYNDWDYFLLAMGA